jgi:hypothetical protein
MSGAHDPAQDAQVSIRLYKKYHRSWTAPRPCWMKPGRGCWNKSDWCM